MSEICRHCGSNISGAYCAKCGQRRTETIDFPKLWRESIEKLADLDLKYPITVFELLRRPGWVIREYLEGNRIPWINPAKYLFLNLTIYVLVLTFVVPDDELILPIAPDADRQTVLFTIGAITYIAFAFLLVPAVAAYWLFRSRLNSVGEAYVAVMYIYATGMLLRSLLSVFVAGPEIGRPLVVAYMLFAIAAFAGKPYWKTLAKGAVVCSVYVLAAGPMMIAIVRAYRLFAA